MIVGLLSGFYNPLTVAHIQSFEAAKQIADKIIVMVNNDEQVKLKGSIPFNTLTDRLNIICKLSMVDSVVASVDTEATMAETIKLLYSKEHPLIGQAEVVIFMNGGDRYQPTEAELAVCKEYNIATMYGVGGYNKVRSSSTLIEDAAQAWIRKNNVFPR